MGEGWFWVVNDAQNSPAWTIGVSGQSASNVNLYRLTVTFEPWYTHIYTYKPHDMLNSGGFG
jgi:hypothetical protein